MTSAQSAAAIDMDHLRSWIGREDVSSDVVSVDLVRKFNATFDVEPGMPQDGDAAPPLIHFCLAQPAVETHVLGEDGHPHKGEFLPPVPLPRRMWAGGSILFHDSLRVGDRVQRTSRICDVSLKEGRTGTLCFVAVRHSIAVAGRLVVEEMQTIVYRRPGTGETAAPEAAAAEAGSHVRRLTVSPVLLFRYSALTFNGHRIHYDRRYATEVERYPGLVVHGPVQATLLLNYAAELKGAPPSRFSFRSVSPLFDGDEIVLHARADGDGMRLWTARRNGPVAMTAEANWS